MFHSLAQLRVLRPLVLAGLCVLARPASAVDAQSPAPSAPAPTAPSTPAPAPSPAPAGSPPAAAPAGSAPAPTAAPNATAPATVGAGPGSIDEVPSAASLGLQERKLDAHSFKVVESYSGSVSYYRIVEDPAEAYIRAVYRPPLETVTLGVEIPENLRQGTKRLRWKWRQLVPPKGGNECKNGAGDSTAVIYISWKRGLKWYSLKYVWSPTGPLGATCDQKRNLFVVQDTVIARSGGSLGRWVTEDIDPSAEFRKHFENGDPKADVPDLVGIGIMSDGDDTKSVSSADYGGFALLY